MNNADRTRTATAPVFVSEFAQKIIFSSSYRREIRLDEESRVDCTTHDPNRVILGRYHTDNSDEKIECDSCDENSENNYNDHADNSENEDDDEDVGGCADGAEITAIRYARKEPQFPTGERRVREFDPRSWRFGQTYVVPEQTSVRYLCLGNTRRSLMCRLLVRYHAHNEHRLELKDVLRAINSPDLRIEQNSGSQSTKPSSVAAIAENTISLPFKLLTMVRATEMREPDFTTAVIETLRNSARLIRNEYVRYDELVGYYRLVDRTDGKFDWRNFPANFCNRLRWETRRVSPNMPELPHVILACPIPQRPTTEYSDFDCDRRRKGSSPLLYDPTIVKRGEILLPLPTLPFVSKRHLHLWLSLDMGQFYNRVLPVLLRDIPHLSIYDRSCATRYSDCCSNDGDDYCSDGAQQQNVLGGHRSCMCVILYKYRVILTKSVIRIILHRMIFDLRYNASKLLPFVDVAKMSDLFCGLMDHGFLCAALPISYFVDARLVLERARSLQSRFDTISKTQSRYGYRNNENYAMCICRRYVLEIGFRALEHIVNVRSIVAARNNYVGPSEMVQMRDRAFAVEMSSSDNLAPNTLQSMALRSVVVSRGISYFLTFAQFVNIPVMFWDCVEVYFRDTFCYFTDAVFESYVPTRDRDADDRQWWHGQSRDRGIDIDRIYNLTNRDEARRLIKRKRTLEADGVNLDEVEIHWSYNGGCRKKKRRLWATTLAEVSATVTAAAETVTKEIEDNTNNSSTGTVLCEKEFTIAPWYDRSAYNAALEYATCSGRLSVKNWHAVFTRNDDRTNFALLGALDRREDALHPRDADTLLEKLTKSYVTNSIPICRWVANRGNTTFAGFAHDRKLHGGRAIANVRGIAVLHSAMRRMPEFLHENVSWLWLRVSADRFCMWFDEMRCQVPFLSMLETDRSRTDVAATSLYKRHRDNSNLDQEVEKNVIRSLFATSFWYAAHNTTVLVNLVRARLETHPEEASALFRDISRWSWWYWYRAPKGGEKRTRTTIQNRSYNNGGPRTNVWILALAALFVQRQDFLKALKNFCYTAICEFAMIEERTINDPLEADGYSSHVMTRIKRLLDAQENGWLSKVIRRCRKSDEDPDSEDDNLEFNVGGWFHEFSDNDIESENVDSLSNVRSVRLDLVTTYSDSAESDAESGAESSAELKTAINSRIRVLFALMSTNGKNSVALRALDCVFVMIGMYRDISGGGRKQRRIEVPLLLASIEIPGVLEWSSDRSRYCCEAFRDAWNEQLCEFADECERSFAELCESTNADFAVSVRRNGITSELEDETFAIAFHSSQERKRAVTSCGRYFSRILWWFVATVMNFERDLCVCCYK